MSERLDITRPLKLRGGEEVRGVYELPQPWAGGCEYVLGGSVKNDDGSWCFETWTASGYFYGDESTSDNDLVYADEPAPEAKPDDMADILDRLHQIEQRLGDIVAKATAMASDAKGCPFERLDAWAKRDPGERSWNVVRQYDGKLAARAHSFGVVEGSVTMQSPHLAAEGLCTELGI